MPDERILMGVVGRPHGVRGLVHVHSYTAEPADLPTYGALLDDSGRRWTLVWRGDGVAEMRDEQGRPLPDRNAAEKLVNTRLSVERSRLPKTEDDEYYLADLVGLAVMSAEGATLGRVTAVHDYGAGASLEIAGEGQPILLPFTRACVPSVDITAGRVIAVLPEEVVVATDAPTTAAGPDQHPA
ncbi:ribosome maturation factor RimM [Acidisphaera sp. L21]|uniref:ribosome maturation factor RimM n=1 Tax=Acidisphaera sp. L21 TaxID=1641851 RepID=UPI00131EA30E|nr:ribosome maturation factor RimM [Acidisphaera sp. L21]